ncbi:MAG: hypothetical protein HKM06_07870 [Spirochaetales bacterium]|nr:hypothetical protein [Spirochaetales bacterium]
MENLWSSFFEAKFAAWNTLSADRIAARRLELQTLCDWFSAQKLETFLTAGLSPDPEVLQEELSRLFSPSEIFLDPVGKVVTGVRSPVLGEGGRELNLLVSDEIQTLLTAHPGAWLGYWNWTSQPTSPEFLLSDWLAWLKDEKILVSGPLEVSFEAWKLYPFGYFGVFAPGFRPSSLEIKEMLTRQSNSFLKRALKLRGKGLSQMPEPAFLRGAQEESLERLPMIPFTLKDLENPHFVWPLGVDNVDLASFKTRQDPLKRPQVAAPIEETFPESEAPPIPAAEPRAPGRGRILLAALLSLGLGLWLASVQTLPLLDILAEFK